MATLRARIAKLENEVDELKAFIASVEAKVMEEEQIIVLDDPGDGSSELIESLGKIGEILVNNGYLNIGMVKVATDEQLLAISGIAEKSLEKIREISG